MRSINKEITFIYTDKLEYQCSQPIAQEAERRGYKIKFSDNILEKCEIGFYCQHMCFPNNSKFSCIMLHDLGQQHGFWPNMWQNEIWSHFDLGFLPSKEWCEMWQSSSCYTFVRPRQGCYFAGWPKADNIKKQFFEDECQKIITDNKIDISRKTVLYAPSWEYDNRQLEIIEACKSLNVNLIIKQFPWNPKESEVFKYQYDLCNEMAEKSKDCPNVYLLDTSINIFNVIHICDVLVSEESSTLYEAMMLGKPVIAVTDWLIPDSSPVSPRNPDFPYSFAVHTEKKDLTKVIESVLHNSSYVEKINQYKLENFPNIGNAARTIMNVLDKVLFNMSFDCQQIIPKKLVPLPKVYKKSIKIRRAAMRHNVIKKKIISKSKILEKIYSFLKSFKHRKEICG